MACTRVPARKTISRNGWPPSTRARATVQRLSDGRDIAICRQPMRGGGWVTTHEDVTERERLKERLEQQNEQLDAALNNMTQGLAMFDSEQRLVVCNERYGEMYRLTAEQVKPGTTLRQLLEYRVASGCHNAGRPRAFRRSSWSRNSTRHPSDIHELADGRIINVAAPQDRQRRPCRHARGHHRAAEAHALLEQNNSC